MKYLLIIGGNEQSYPVISFAKERGYKILLIDKDKHCPGSNIADFQIIESIYNRSKIIEELDRLNLPIVGAICIAADAPLTLSRICSKYSLKGPSEYTAKHSSNKILMKELFLKNNLLIPHFAKVSKYTEIIDLFSRFPKLVIKPSDSRGARGVFLLEKSFSKQQIKFFFNESLKYSPSSEVMVEEYLEGDQLSTESIIIDGCSHTIGVSDRNYSMLERFLPNIIEDGGDMPSKYIGTYANEINMLVQNVANVFKMKNGILKGDLVINDNQLKIIEFACRGSGGYFCTHQIPLQTGVNFIDLAIKNATGQKIHSNEFNVSSEPLFVSQRYMFSEPGKIKRIKIPSRLDDYRIEYIDITCKLGDVVEKTTAHTSRLGMVICSGNSREHAMQNVDTVIKSIEIALEE